MTSMTSIELKLKTELAKYEKLGTIEELEKCLDILDKGINAGVLPYSSENICELICNKHFSGLSVESIQDILKVAHPERFI